MADSPVKLESLPWRRMIPWLHLARAFWIAVDLRKLVLAAAGLLLISAGLQVCDALPFGQAARAQRAAAPVDDRWPWQIDFGYSLPMAGGASQDARQALAQPGQAIQAIVGNWRLVLHPIGSVLEPALVLFRGDTTLSALADAVTRLLWILCVWAVLGGAITRIAAVQFARDQQVGLRTALAFSATRFLDYISAPALPLAAVAILWGLCVIGGWLGRLPGGAGDIILGTLWGLELVLGLLMAVVLIGLAVGWPLIFATIAVEGTDGFDGLSRMYNYVFERPLYYLWQVVLAVVYGSVVIFFVWMMAVWMVHLSVWGVSWGKGYESTLSLMAGAPELVAGQSLAARNPPETLGADLARGWMCGLATLVVAFVYSYFWTITTIIYFVLRRSVDANDFDEVYVHEDDEADDLLPMFGTAGMQAAGDVRTGNPSENAPPATPPVDLTP